jgi:hypothetical protein
MAKNDVKSVRVVGIRATTVGMLQGTFFMLLGIVTAVSYTISASVQFAESTESVLRGMTFGLAHGFVAIVLVPIIYFAAGWVVGTVYGWIINALLGGSGGIVLETTEE